MNLTEAQRAALNAVCAGSIVRGEFPTQTYESVFLAGLRMGRAEGREQAAKACKDEQDRIQRSWERAGWNEGPLIGGHRCAEVIAALPEEPTCAHRYVE